MENVLAVMPSYKEEIRNIVNNIALKQQNTIVMEMKPTMRINSFSDDMATFKIDPIPYSERASKHRTARQNRFIAKQARKKSKKKSR